MLTNSPPACQIKIEHSVARRWSGVNRLAERRTTLTYGPLPKDLRKLRRNDSFASWGRLPTCRLRPDLQTSAGKGGKTKCVSPVKGLFQEPLSRLPRDKKTVPLEICLTGCFPGVRMNASCLRQSSVTHLLEDGYNLRTIYEPARECGDDQDQHARAW
jgi:hypothetical protein